MTVWRMCIARWLPKATDTHTIFYTHCFPTIPLAAKTHPDVTTYVVRLSFSFPFNLTSYI